MEKEIQKKSLETFFRLEYRKLVNFVSKNLDDRFFEASPEDIVQDVVVGMIDKIEVDTQIGNLSAYIYRSIRNRIIDYQKKKKRSVSLENFTDKKNENYLNNRRCRRHFRYILNNFQLYSNVNTFHIYFVMQIT